MQVHRRVQARLGSYDAQRTQDIFKSAAACYAALSARLGEGRAYFYGDRPRSLDAAVFAHLAVHLYAPMVDSKLSALLRKHPNLENFVANFRSKHLGLGGRCAGKALRAAEKSLI
jgi:glutathione S-transferase